MEVVMGKFYCSKPLVVRLGRWKKPVGKSLGAVVFGQELTADDGRPSVFSDLSVSY
jgi:hypothetical protein